MTTMEAYITADIMLTTRGSDGAEARVRELLAEARADGDLSRTAEWTSVRQALHAMN